MIVTNVELSKNELELVCSSEFILTKNRIIEKAYNLFGLLSEAYKTTLNNYKEVLPPEVFATSPKIYKGENYLSLPYVLMDHPRLFSKDDVLAIRSFLWWGNFFSITLHLSGRYLHMFKHTIRYRLKEQHAEDCFVCINDEQWQHHFEKTNYAALNETEFESIFERPFIKLSKKLDLKDWEKAPAFFENNYAGFLQLLAPVNYPGGERVL
jgi:hypothetical protein